MIALLGVVLSLILSAAYTQFSYWESDTVSYLFQAKLFAQSRLAAEAPPDFGFSPSIHLNITNGKWYSKYPFGNALALSLGVLVGAPWLVPALATGASILLLHRIVLHAYGRPVALLAGILVLISPATLVLGAMWFSEAVNRLFLALFLLGLIRLVTRKAYISGILAGFALGYSFNTRPLTAAVFGVGGASFFLYCSLQNKQNRWMIVRRAASIVLPFSFMLGLSLCWNFHLTGSAWQFTHSVMHPYDRIGFGPRTDGYFVDPEKEFHYSPQRAARRLLTSTIPAVSFNSLGWGYYRPGLARQLFTGPARSTLLLVLVCIPLALVPLLMLFPLGHASRNRYDLLFLSFPMLTLAVYFFYYFDGSTWGFSPAHTRYYAECTMFGVLPLVARGMHILYEKIRLAQSHHARPVVALFICLLLINTLFSYFSFAGGIRAIGGTHRELRRLVREQELHGSVIFLRPGDFSPIGDYPFRPLKDADVVYYRLGPSQKYGLTESDWRVIYRKYFVGRRAYLFDGDHLVFLTSSPP